jgi:peptide/nickel transport system ATP-binding protein
MVLITHDLSIVAETCEKIVVMYAGKIVEYGAIGDIFQEPLHPYTQGLLGAFPKIQQAKTRLVSIPGQPPDLLSPPPACRFNPRCPFVMDICRKIEPDLTAHGKTAHLTACHLYD